MRHERTLAVGFPCSDCRMHEVVVGALVRGGQVLLVHRSPNKHAYPDVWDLPGGLIEAGESELDALTRELHEELGVQIAPASVAHLCRLTVGPAEEPALLSAWLVHDCQRTPLPRNTTTSDGSTLSSCLPSPTCSCARLWSMRCGVTEAELQRAANRHVRETATGRHEAERRG